MSFMRRRVPSRPGLQHPNQKNGGMEVFKDGVGTAVIVGATGQVPTVQADGSVEFATPTVATEYVTGRKITPFTGSGTFTTDAKCLFAWVRGVGGGGGGGGVDLSSAFLQGAGGGSSGGWCEEWYTAADLGSSQTVTIGAAGSAGSSSGGTGGSGGNTTFGSLFTASGGPGGVGTGAALAATASFAGGAGGAASGADVNVPGQPGGYGFAGASGAGGSNPFGAGGASLVAEGTGNAGAGFGAGGGGGYEDDASTGRAGGAGTAGFVVVVEFLKP